MNSCNMGVYARRSSCAGDDPKICVQKLCASFVFSSMTVIDRILLCEHQLALLAIPIKCTTTINVYIQCAYYN